jgi:hypothetical protein
VLPVVIRPALLWMVAPPPATGFAAASQMLLDQAAPVVPVKLSDVSGCDATPEAVRVPEPASGPVT